MEINGESYYYNVVLDPVSFEEDVTWFPVLMNNGKKTVFPAADPNQNGSLDKIKVYDSLTLGEESVVASREKETLSLAVNPYNTQQVIYEPAVIVSNCPAMASLEGIAEGQISVKQFCVDINKDVLSAGKTYYLVVEKGLKNKNGDYVTDNSYILEFTVAGKAPAQADPTLVSSAGNELKARTHTTLTLENAPTGEGYTYKFIVYNTTTNSWYKLQDFGPETTFDWYTGPAGVKNLYADIKDADNNVTRVALEGVNVTDSALAVKSFTISPEGTLPTKSQATLTAEAEKGTEPYEYKFIVYNSTTEQWYKLKDFGPENTFDWYTGPAGNKTLYVDVKDATGKVVRAPLEVTVK